MKFKGKIEKRIGLDYKLISIVPLRKFPKKRSSYITWSIGAEAETDYMYKLVCENKLGELETIYCDLTTVLSLFPLRYMFFKEGEFKMEEIEIKKT